MKITDSKDKLILCLRLLGCIEYSDPVTVELRQPTFFYQAEGGDGVSWSLHSQLHSRRYEPIILK